MFRDTGRIADEVLTHIIAIPNAKVKVHLEIEADIPEGASEQLVRTVTENAKTLKFKDFGVEEE